MIVFDVVDALFVSIERKVGMAGTKGPDFDGAIETCRCKRVIVFRIDSYVHNVVRVSFVNLPDAQRLSNSNLDQGS